MMNANIKNEPNDEYGNTISELSIANIKHEPTSNDPIVTEFDAEIFLHNSSEQQQYKEFSDTDGHWNIDNGEKFVFVDEIIKEEPVFYDSNGVEILRTTQNASKNDELELLKNRNWQTLTEEQDDNNAHMANEKETLFKCEHCAEIFHQEWIFNRHQKVHGIQKSFDCRLCSRKFANKLQLIGHERIHTNQKSLVRKNPVPLPKPPMICDGNSKTSVKSVKERKGKERKNDVPSAANDQKTIFKCEHCPKTFQHEWVFKRHQKWHNTEKSFGCNICSRKFATSARLTAHERIHTNQKSLDRKKPGPLPKSPTKRDGNSKTSKPLKEEKSREQNKDTLLAENEQKTIFECEQCPKTFQHEWPFKRHQKWHNTEKSYDCSLCPRKFASRARLTTHERIHTGQKPYECEVCHKKFNQKYHVDLHMRIHTGEKPFSCAECGMRFRLKQHLDSHIKVRSKNKAHHLLHQAGDLRGGIAKNPIVPMAEIMSHHAVEIRIFECYLCHIQCYRNDLRAHIKTEHCGEKIYPCKICGKKFTNKNRIIEHGKSHSAQPEIQCQVCGRQFLRKDSLKQHIETHVTSYQCKFCPKVLSTKHILTTHLKTHTGLRPFQCDAESCGKTFLKRGDMVRHQRIHTGERPYICDVCNRSFTRNHTLTEHKEKMHWMK